MGREAPVDGPRETRHVEEHVDRDHDDQHRREEELEDRDRSALRPRDRLRRVLLHVFRPDVVEEVLALLADLDLLQVVAVEPELEPVEVALGVRLAALSVLDRKVGIDAIGRLPCLVHDHGRECHDRQTDSSGKAQVDDRHGEPTRNPHAPEPAHERVQEQRDERGDEEEEDDVTRRARYNPDQEQQNRKPDELDPARDLDLRRPAGHGSHRSASVVRLRPPPWDWSAFEDGSVALDPLWEDPRHRSRCRPQDVQALPARPSETTGRAAPNSSQPGRTRPLHGQETSVSVPRMPPRPAGKPSPARGHRPPRASTRPRPRPRPRPKRRTARGARRFVGLVVLAVVAIVTTLLTAFGDGRKSAAVDSVLAPPGGLVYYRLGGAGTPTGSLDVGAAPGTDVYAPVDGSITGLTDYVVNGRKFGVRIDIQPTNAPSMVVSLTHVRADPSLTVGSAVVAATSKIGTVVDLSHVEREALARYTRDSGNHVSLEVHEAASLVSP